MLNPEITSMLTRVREHHRFETSDLHNDDQYLYYTQGNKANTVPLSEVKGVKHVLMKGWMLRNYFMEPGRIYPGSVREFEASMSGNFWFTDKIYESVIVLWGDKDKWRISFPVLIDFDSNNKYSWVQDEYFNSHQDIDYVYNYIDQHVVTNIASRRCEEIINKKRIDIENYSLNATGITVEDSHLLFLKKQLSVSYQDISIEGNGLREKLELRRSSDNHRLPYISDQSGRAAVLGRVIRLMQK